MPWIDVLATAYKSALFFADRHFSCSRVVLLHMRYKEQALRIVRTLQGIPPRKEKSLRVELLYSRGGTFYRFDRHLNEGEELWSQ